MSKLIKDITGVPDGEIYPRKIAAGEVCPPALLDYAAEVGALEPGEEDTPTVPPAAAEPTAKDAAKGQDKK